MNLNNVIQEAHMAQVKALSVGYDCDIVINEYKEYVNNNFDLFEKAYKIDKNLDLSKEKILAQFEIDNFSKYKVEAFMNEFGKVGNLSVPYGVLGVISDCNIYNVLRLIVLAIYTKNAMIFNLIDNLGTNYLFIQSINDILDKYDTNGFIQIYNNNAGEKLEESENIDGIIYIGKKVNCDRLKISSICPIIYSGCGNYELYVEDVLDENVVAEALKMQNVKIYSRKGIGIGQEVSGVDEALIRISESGSEYACAIITESRENAKTFVNNVKSRNIFVNALPTLINDKLDIEPDMLMYKKSVLVFE